MDQVTVAEGVSLEYAVSGAGDPVLFIHGALIADAFDPLVPELRHMAEYRYITYHRRGYAGSSRTAAVTSVRQHAEDCVALLRSLAIERVHVAGHSYGGSVALQLALDAPGLVHSLALLEPAIFAGSGAQPYREALEQGRTRFREGSPETVVDEFLAPRFGPDYRSGLDRALPGAFPQAVADAATWFEHEMPGLVNWVFEQEQAEAVQCPVLTVLGAESEELWPRFGETFRTLLAWLPNVMGFVLLGAAHGLQMQNPSGLAGMLATFWGRHPITRLQA